MGYIDLDKRMARLILLQRIELASPILVKIRKSLGRYLFTNLISKYFISTKSINLRYYELMKKEYSLLKEYIDFQNKEILSIGAGMCGLELIINYKSNNSIFTIIEKNYVSKKVKYGWDEKNNEAYNNLKILKYFLEKNGMKNNFKIFDFDKDNLPIKKFDIVISLYSLDYHYDFSNYFEYLKKVSSDRTKIIFDSVRPEYFKKLFQNVEIISSDQKSIHASKRIICNKFRN